MGARVFDCTRQHQIGAARLLDIVKPSPEPTSLLGRIGELRLWPIVTPAVILTVLVPRSALIIVSLTVLVILRMALPPTDFDSQVTDWQQE